MNCDIIKQELLNGDWDKSKRERMAELLAHLERCESCRSAMEDFDRIRAFLRLRESEAEPTGGWSAFENRILRKATPKHLRWKLMPVALAASILLAVIGWGMYLRTGAEASDHPSLAENRMPSLGFTSREVADRVHVFDKVSETFDRCTGWVMIADQASDLGLGRDPVTGSTKLLLLRLTVSRDNTIISSADLVIVPGQTARLTVPSDGGLQFRYHITTSQGEPTRMQLWVEVEKSPKAWEILAALATDLRLQPGEVMSAGQMVTSSGSYDVHVGVYRTDLPAKRL